jgi:hypothetical protein
VSEDDRQPREDLVQRLVAGRDPIKVALVMFLLMLPLLLAPLGLVLLLVWLL